MFAGGPSARLGMACDTRSGVLVVENSILWDSRTEFVQPYGEARHRSPVQFAAVFMRSSVPEAAPNWPPERRKEGADV